MGDIHKQILTFGRTSKYIIDVSENANFSFLMSSLRYVNHYCGPRLRAHGSCIAARYEHFEHWSSLIQSFIRI